MHNEKLTKDTACTLVNEIFILDKEENEKNVETFIQDRDIKFN